MKKTDLSNALRQHSKDYLSPTAKERETVSNIYAGIQVALGANNCIQIGSYPRFTAVTPLHDLDVLFVVGSWNAATSNPAKTLADLDKRLRDGFKNPTKLKLKISQQTHSISIQFMEGEEEILSVDIVPAFTSGRNEFGRDTYVVPEIVRRGHAARRREYEQLAKAHREVQWIKSDPLGYIEVAKRTNDKNNDFRKAVKIVKAWHYACKEEFGSPLKSFHIEQVITRYFQEGTIDIFDAVFRFFVDLPETIRQPQFRDRADANRFIDEYVREIGFPERRTLMEARDAFLIRLEDIEPGKSVAGLLTAELRERKSANEAYLFDKRIPTLTEYPLSIVATVLERHGSFRRYILDKLGIIVVDRSIEFRVKAPIAQANEYKWKVKNDDNSPQPRGEITDHRTQNDPENTKYNGSHYVECYAIRNDICIAKARQDVRLRA
jgi:hypothetical protein